MDITQIWVVIVLEFIVSSLIEKILIYWYLEVGINK